MTRCCLLHQPLRSGGAREATRADKKKTQKKSPPCRRRRASEGGKVALSHLSGAREQDSPFPSPLQFCAKSRALACARAAMKMLALACPPGSGLRRVGGKWAAAGAGMENPCEKQKNMRRVKSGWKKSPSQCMQKHNPNDLWRVEKYHRVITTFPPRYHRTRRRTGPPTSWAARNRRPAHQKCAPRRLSLLQEPPVNRDISPLVPILVRKSNSLSPLSRLHGRRATPWPRRHRAILRPRKKNKKV